MSRGVIEYPAAEALAPRRIGAVAGRATKCALAMKTWCAVNSGIDLVRVSAQNSTQGTNKMNKTAIEVCPAPLVRQAGKLRSGPSGMHLFYRSNGLNVLFDEVCVAKAYWSRAPRQVSIALTNACDLHCPYCYAPKIPAMVDFDQVCGWLKELDANGCLGVGFGGGEPTLYRRFADLCRFVAMETKLAVTFTTHGHHLDDSLVAALKGSVHFFRVSMDGVGSTYEKLRGRSFLTLRQHLRRARALAPFGINYVVSAETISDLNTATSLAIEVGASEFLLLPEQPVRGRAGIDAHTMEKLRCWVSFYRGSLPLAISEVAAEGFPVCNPLSDETGLRAYAHINASSLLKPNSFDPAGVAIGGDGIMRALEILKNEQEVSI